MFLLTNLCTFLLLSPAILSAAAFVPPIQCTGPASSNPPSGLDYQDASYIKRASDGLWFRYTKSNSSGDGLSVATAHAIRGPWNYAFEILAGSLNSPIVPNGARPDTDVWGPEAHFINNTYYIFFGTHVNNSIKESDHFDMTVATSPSMEPNSWTSHGSLGIETDPQQVSLGGSLAAPSTDPQGVTRPPFMSYGSFNDGIYGVYLQPDLLSVRNSSKYLLVTDQPNPSPYSGNKTEGSYLIENGAFIYLFYSTGSCCGAGNASVSDSVYRTYVCRTSAANGPTGPYHDRSNKPCAGALNGAGTEILASSPDGSVFAPGSVSITNDAAEGGLLLMYQYRNLTDSTHKGLRFGFNYLEFQNGWPVLVASRNTA